MLPLQYILWIIFFKVFLDKNNIRTLRKVLWTVLHPPNIFAADNEHISSVYYLKRIIFPEMIYNPNRIPYKKYCPMKIYIGPNKKSMIWSNET